LDLQERLIFSGFRRDAGTVYAALDVYVSSALSEGLSNAILEAMHCGLPVVATAVGGTAESVTDGENGLLTRPGETGALAAAMIRLFDDPRLRQAMGDKGRARALESFSIARMVHQYEQLYVEELGRRGLA
jgi:glycosyltransferase involved in cell wall biosynthesis